ncbi:MAG: hypothetical protein JWP58_2382 [Hymenobacter sp.]|nr:hypothetical protein [Hymenobacter sp.]
MSQLFSFSRFGRLFSKHTTEQAGGYLLAAGVLLGGIGLVLGFVAVSSSQPVVPDIQGVIFVMGLLAAGAFFTSTVFSFYGNRKQATAALMLPASHWEKYLVGWLYSVPLFMAVYVGCFYLIDALVVSLDDWHGRTPELVRLFSNESKLYWALVGYAVVNAVFLWGSIFFQKQQFIRTAFGLLLGGVLVSVANMQVVKGLVGRKLDGVLPFAGMGFREGKEWYSVNLPPPQNSWFLLVPVGVMLLAWAAAYMRVTEKQI